MSDLSHFVKKNKKIIKLNKNYFSQSLVISQKISRIHLPVKFQSTFKSDTLYYCIIPSPLLFISYDILNLIKPDTNLLNVKQTKRYIEFIHLSSIENGEANFPKKGRVVEFTLLKNLTFLKNYTFSSVKRCLFKGYLS